MIRGFVVCSVQFVKNLKKRDKSFAHGFSSIGACFEDFRIFTGGRGQNLFRLECVTRYFSI